MVEKVPEFSAESLGLHQGMAMNIPSKKKKRLKKRPEHQPETRKTQIKCRHSIHIQGLEQVPQIFKKHGVSMYHKPTNLNHVRTVTIKIYIGKQAD